MSTIRPIPPVVPLAHKPRAARTPEAAPANRPTDTVHISAEARAKRAGGLPLFASKEDTEASDASADATPRIERRLKLAASPADGAEAAAGVSNAQADERLESLGREQKAKQGGSRRDDAVLPSIERRIKVAGGPAEADTATPAPPSSETGTLDLARMERVIKLGPVASGDD